MTAYAWHVAAVKPLSEFVAEDNLARQGFQPFNPRCADTRIDRGRRLSVESPYFRGYIFVRFDRDDSERWPKINSTRGIHRLLPEASERPTPMPEGVMGTLLKLCSSGQMVDAEHVDRALGQLLPAGSTVRLSGEAMGHAFEGYHARVKWAYEDRVVALMSFLGATREVKLHRRHVEPV